MAQLHHWPWLTRTPIAVTTKNGLWCHLKLERLRRLIINMTIPSRFIIKVRVHLVILWTYLKKIISIIAKIECWLCSLIKQQAITKINLPQIKLRKSQNWNSIWNFHCKNDGSLEVDKIVLRSTKSYSSFVRYLKNAKSMLVK